MRLLLIVVIIVSVVAAFVIWQLAKLALMAVRVYLLPRPPGIYQTPEDVAIAADIPLRGGEVKGHLFLIYGSFAKKKDDAVLDMLVNVLDEQGVPLVTDVTCRLTPIELKHSVDKPTAEDVLKQLQMVWMGSLTRDGILRGVVQDQQLIIEGSPGPDLITEGSPSPDLNYRGTANELVDQTDLFRLPPGEEWSAHVFASIIDADDVSGGTLRFKLATLLHWPGASL